MKIVCMIGTPPYLHHFVNEIAQHHEVSLVIREDARTGGGILKKIRNKGLVKTAALVIHRLRNFKKLSSEYDAVFGEDWRRLSGDVPVFTTTDINSDAVKQQLQEIQPDLVLVHGTSLIKNKTLEGMPLVLNLHWGLSPYYKGSYCTQWALINRDPLNIGFTIHAITAQIDGGEILTQDHAEILPTDTANRINMRLTKSGTAEMIRVIDRIKAHETPVFKTQDPRLGHLYLVKHWTTIQEKQISGIENSAAIAAMIASPSAAKKPIVRW